MAFTCGATRPLLVSVALIAALTVPAAAANTGTVSGAVFDQAGTPVADAAVRISGDLLPGGRTAQTDDNGVYRFEYLLPGEYMVEAGGAGTAAAKRAAIVELGKDTQLD